MLAYFHPEQSYKVRDYLCHPGYPPLTQPGVGVGNANASPTNALLLHILQDTSGRIATILFAHRVGTALEPECKTYRLAADVFNDIAMILDCLSPMVPSGVMRVSILSTAGVLRALCGVAGGSSKASLSAHFAKRGNLAELNAVINNSLLNIDPYNSNVSSTNRKIRLKKQSFLSSECWYVISVPLPIPSMSHRKPTGRLRRRLKHHQPDNNMDMPPLLTRQPLESKPCSCPIRSNDKSEPTTRKHGVLHDNRKRQLRHQKESPPTRPQPKS